MVHFVVPGSTGVTEHGDGFSLQPHASTLLANNDAPPGGQDVAGEKLALGRRRDVSSMPKRLAPPSTLAVEGARAGTAGVAMRRPSGNEGLVELACDPRS